MLRNTLFKFKQTDVMIQFNNTWENIYKKRLWFGIFMSQIKWNLFAAYTN